MTQIPLFREIGEKMHNLLREKNEGQKSETEPLNSTDFYKSRKNTLYTKSKEIPNLR